MDLYVWEIQTENYTINVLASSIKRAMEGAVFFEKSVFESVQEEGDADEYIPAEVLSAKVIHNVDVVFIIEEELASALTDSVS